MESACAEHCRIMYIQKKCAYTMTWNCLRKTHGTKETVALAAAVNSHRAERITLNLIAVNVEDRTKQKNMDNLSWPNITENICKLASNHYSLTLNAIIFYLI